MVGPGSLEDSEKISGTFNVKSSDPTLPPRDRILVMDLNVPPADKERYKMRLALETKEAKRGKWTVTWDEDNQKCSITHKEWAVKKGKRYKKDVSVSAKESGTLANINDAARDWFKEERNNRRYYTRMEEALVNGDVEAFNEVKEELEARYPGKTLVFDAIIKNDRYYTFGARDMNFAQIDGGPNTLNFSGPWEFVNLRMTNGIIQHADFNTQAFKLSTHLQEKPEDFKPYILGNSIIGSSGFVSEDLPPSEDDVIYMDVAALSEESQAKLPPNQGFISRDCYVDEFMDPRNPDGMVTNTNDYLPNIPFTTLGEGALCVAIDCDLPDPPEDENVVDPLAGVELFESRGNTVGYHNFIESLSPIPNKPGPPAYISGSIKYGEDHAGCASAGRRHAGHAKQKKAIERGGKVKASYKKY